MKPPQYPHVFGRYDHQGWINYSVKRRQLGNTNKNTSCQSTSEKRYRVISLLFYVAAGSTTLSSCFGGLIRKLFWLEGVWDEWDDITWNLSDKLNLLKGSFWLITKAKTKYLISCSKDIVALTGSFQFTATPQGDQRMDSEDYLLNENEIIVTFFLIRRWIQIFYCHGYVNSTLSLSPSWHRKTSADSLIASK